MDLSPSLRTFIRAAAAKVGGTNTRAGWNSASAIAGAIYGARSVERRGFWGFVKGTFAAAIGAAVGLAVSGGITAAIDAIRKTPGPSTPRWADGFA